MSRTSRIKAVREYLEEEITISQCILLGAIKDEDFVKAAWVKEFKVKLEKALSLCGELKPIEGMVDLRERQDKNEC